jgi:hypothetical protein
MRETETWDQPQAKRPLPNYKLIIRYIFMHPKIRGRNACGYGCWKDWEGKVSPVAHKKMPLTGLGGLLISPVVALEVNIPGYSYYSAIS